MYTCNVIVFALDSNDVMLMFFAILGREVFISPEQIFMCGLIGREFGEEKDLRQALSLILAGHLNIALWYLKLA